VTETFNLYDAKTHLSELVERAAAGEEIVIAKAGEPKARLMPLRAPKKKKKRRELGFLRGKIWIADDFDAPLPDDLLDLFEGKEPKKPG